MADHRLTGFVGKSRFAVGNLTLSPTHSRGKSTGLSDASMYSPAVRRRRRRVADDKRRRAARACNHCKARKSKCVESLAGKCERCSTAKLDCRFEKERSSSPPQFIQSSPSSLLPVPIANAPQNSVSQNPEAFSPASELSQGLSTHVIADQSKKASWPNFLCRLREAFSLDPYAAVQEHDMVCLQARMTRPRALNPQELSRLQTAIESFPPRPVADFLLSVFINHATDAFFYIDQDQFFIELNQFYTESSSPLRSDAGFVCLAMSVFALGSQWTTLERPENLPVTHLKENVDIGRHFFRQARILVPDIIERTCLRSIQAVFVLGVYLMPASAIGSSYIYMGLALRKALAADLHVRSEDAGLSDSEREVRRRLLWSIYSLERCTTIKLNRPRSISADIITVPPPAPCQPLDRVQRFDNVHFQIAYTRLVLILDQIAGLSGDTTGTQENGCSKLEADLKSWKRSLPSTFDLEHINPKSSPYRTITHLYLNYYYAWITMGKVALVTVARTRLRKTLDPISEYPRISENVRRLSQACTKAARKTLQLFENLSRTNNITRFSFTDFQGCSIATIVTLVAGILERDSGYSHRVQLGIDCLKKMAKGNMTAKLGVKFVEAVQPIANEAAEKLRSAEVANHGLVDTTSRSQYNQWATWLAAQDHTEDDQECTSRDEVSTNYASRQLDPWKDPEPARGIASWESTNNPLSMKSAAQSTFTDDEIARHIAESSMEDDIFSGFQNDDHAFLMGLTGLDALDFSGLVGP